MSGFEAFWEQGDAITRGVALLLLLMSVSAWVVIFWKGWLLRRARTRHRARSAAHSGLRRRWPRGARSWRSSTAKACCSRCWPPRPQRQRGHARGDAGTLESQLTRRLRDALHAVLAQLQFGQVLLASIGSTAPFVGLFGTVWGIYHALISISAAGAITIEKVSGPVGEALVMTAAGLAVAIPAVLALQHLRQAGRRLRGRARRLRARPARDADRTSRDMTPDTVAPRLPERPATGSRSALRPQPRSGPR